MKAVDFRYVLRIDGKEENSYINWDLQSTEDLLKAKFFRHKRAAEDTAKKLEYLTIPVRIRMTLEAVPEPSETYGDTVRGDDYPKHLDYL